MKKDYKPVLRGARLVAVRVELPTENAKRPTGNAKIGAGSGD